MLSKRRCKPPLWDQHGGPNSLGGPALMIMDLMDAELPREGGESLEAARRRRMGSARKWWEPTRQAPRAAQHRRF